MQMFVEDSSSSFNRLVMITEHNGEQLHWNVSTYEKHKIEDGKEITKHINAYWASLDQKTQNSIFDYYKQIKIKIEYETQTQELMTALPPLVAGLLNLHDLDDVENYVIIKSDIIIDPVKFKDTYEKDDEKPGNREKTYTRSDYRKLLSLSIVLRVMIPVWGEFIHNTEGDTGNLYKDYCACMLLDKSDISVSQAIDKLRIYITQNIQADKTQISTIIQGISTEDYPQILLSSVLIRRLSTGDLSGSHPSTTLVTYIYNFITNKNGNGSNSLATSVKVKMFSSDNRNASEDSASRLEEYKVRRETTIGDTAVFEHYLNNPHRVLSSIDPLAGQEQHDLLDELLKDNQSLMNEKLHSPQIVLIQYLLKSVLPPRAVSHISKEKTITAMSIAQTILFNKKHYVLGCLISAKTVNINGIESHGGIPSRTRVSKEMIDKIQEYYPFSKTPRQRIKTGIVKPKPNNTAITAIDNLSIEFGRQDWLLTAPVKFVNEVTGRGDLNRRYSCPINIKVLLATLIIELVEDRKPVVQI